MHVAVLLVVMNVTGLYGWLNKINTIPDILSLSNTKADGNLAATLILPDPIRKTFGFDLVELRDRSEWLAELKSRDTSYYPEAMNEVNLFVSVLVYCANVATRRQVGVGKDEWADMAIDVKRAAARFALDDWVWLLDGQSVIDHFQWRRLRLTPSENSLDISIQPQPDWLFWEWLPTHYAVSPNSAVFKQITADVPEIWLPTVDLTGMPVSVTGLMMEWLRRDARGAEVLAVVPWYVYTPAHLDLPITHLQARLPQYAPQAFKFQRPALRQTTGIDDAANPRNPPNVPQPPDNPPDNGGDEQQQQQDDDPFGRDWVPVGPNGGQNGAQQQPYAGQQQQQQQAPPNGQPAPGPAPAPANVQQQAQPPAPPVDPAPAPDNGGAQPANGGQPGN